MENRIPWKFEVPMFNYAHKIEMQNIFDNTVVYDEVFDLCEGYARGEMTFANFTKSFDLILKSMYWSRYQYEIGLTKPLWSEKDMLNPQKVPFIKADVYSLIKPNIEIVAKYVIDTFNNSWRE